MSNLKPKFGPKVCLAPPCQAFYLTLVKTLVVRSPHVKLETHIRAKALSSPTMPSLQPYIGAKTLVLRSRMSNLKPKFGPKVCLAPPCQPSTLHWGKTLVGKLETQIRKVCLAPPCQAFNLTLGQNACFALPHVKLETQIRAKGLSSPTMPSLQPCIGAKTLVLRSRMSSLKPKFGPKVCLAPPCQAFNLTLVKTLVVRSRMSNLKPKFGPKVCLAPPCQAFNLTLGQNACFALAHVKNFKPQFGPKLCLAPPCQAFNLIEQNACFALPHVKLQTQIRAKALSSPTMPSLQPYIGAKRLFCAPACQT